MSHMGMKHKVQIPIITEPSVHVWLPSGHGSRITYPSNDLIEKYKGWCRERVGANGWNYYGRYRKQPCEFRFKREEDLLAFRLVFGL